MLSSGIGLGLTQALLERGWRVVATSRSISKSKDLKPSPDLILVDGEVSKKETAVKVVEAALKHFGRIDRMGEVSDIVDAVLYLQNATFVTGENIRVDGGVHAGR
jgi:NAD(P)-dependent dehydrogenase (short-subunit alcohol dehydrogenase family)